MRIVTLTSNAYVHCLPAFSYFFNKFYPNQQVTVVRYDVRPPKLPDNFTNFAVGKQEDYSWSSGLKAFLNRIDDDLVLLMLEDYWLDQPVDSETIQLIQDVMETDKRIVKFDLTNDRLKVGHKPVNFGNMNIKVLQSNNDAPFTASVQAAIWRKDFLVKLLQSKEDAWEFEKNGSKRAEKILNRTDSVILGCYNPPMSYVNAVGGMGNKPNEYDFKKIPRWMQEELESRSLI
jgi:hypothetical protein